MTTSAFFMPVLLSSRQKAVCCGLTVHTEDICSGFKDDSDILVRDWVECRWKVIDDSMICGVLATYGGCSSEPRQLFSFLREAGHKHNRERWILFRVDDFIYKVTATPLWLVTSAGMWVCHLNMSKKLRISIRTYFCMVQVKQKWGFVMAQQLHVNARIFPESREFIPLISMPWVHACVFVCRHTTCVDQYKDFVLYWTKTKLLLVCV